MRSDYHSRNSCFEAEISKKAAQQRDVSERFQVSSHTISYSRENDREVWAEENFPSGRNRIVAVVSEVLMDTPVCWKTAGSK